MQRSSQLATIRTVVTTRTLTMTGDETMKTKYFESRREALKFIKSLRAEGTVIETVIYPWDDRWCVRWQ